MLHDETGDRAGTGSGSLPQGVGPHFPSRGPMGLSIPIASHTPLTQRHQRCPIETGKIETGKIATCVPTENKEAFAVTEFTG